jgi:hypothetical protein
VPGPTRAQTLVSVDVDYSAIPVLSPVDFAPDARGPCFGPYGRLYSLLLGDDVFSELAVGNALFFDVPKEFNRRNGRDKLVDPAKEGARGSRLCVEHNGESLPVKWAGFETKTISKDRLDFLYFEGALSTTDCECRPEHAFRARAYALVPWALYAYRVPLASNSSDDASELLEIIAPRSYWVGSTGFKGIEGRYLARPFTRIAVPIRRGESAAAIIDVAIDDLDIFISHSGKSAAEWLTATIPDLPTSAADYVPTVSFSIDIIWPASDELPSALASVAAFNEEASHLAQAPPHFDPLTATLPPEPSAAPSDSAVASAAPSASGRPSWQPEVVIDPAPPPAPTSVMLAPRRQLNRTR